MKGLFFILFTLIGVTEGSLAQTATNETDEALKCFNSLYVSSSPSQPVLDTIFHCRVVYIHPGDTVVLTLERDCMDIYGGVQTFPSFVDWIRDSVVICQSCNNPYPVTQFGFYTSNRTPNTRIGVFPDNTSTADSAALTSVAVDTIAESEHTFVLFPNPASDFLQLKYLLGQSDKVQIDIFNGLGQTIGSFSENAPRGDFNKNISLEEFSAGVYFLGVKSTRASFIKKFIKL